MERRDHFNRYPTDEFLEHILQAIDIVFPEIIDCSEVRLCPSIIHTTSKRV